MLKKMVLRVALGSVLVLMSGTVWAATTYNFPVDFATNPTGDWSLYAGPQSWSTVNDLTLMETAGSGAWQNPANDWVPTYSIYGFPNWMLSEMSADHWSDTAVCVFTCPQTGKYSLDNLGIFSLGTYMGTSGIPEYLQVLTAPDASTPATERWAQTHTWTYLTSYYDDLALAPSLQDMTLAAGSKIIFAFHLRSGSNYMQVLTSLKAGGVADDPYNAPAGGSLSYIPEPVTLVLLGLGLLGLRRRS